MLTTVDLFAGAGGLALGFHEAGGFEPVLGVEIDHAAASTFKTNFGCDVHDGPIQTRLNWPDADIIVGGPPCQGFSPLGRDRDDASRADLNSLWEHCVRAVKAIRPKAFVIENVPEFQRSPQFAELLRLLTTDKAFRGYKTWAGVLNAADYGAAQRRKRGLLIAVRCSHELTGPPRPTHQSSAGGVLPKWRTVRDEIGDLPRLPGGLEPLSNADGSQHLHFGRTARPDSLARYRAIPPGGNRFDLARNRPDLLPRCWAEKRSGTADVMGRMEWDKPSLTIRTEFFKPEKGRYLHPEADRPITHREAARLQSFPDDFFFEGTKIEIARQIGNAVPPRLGMAIARYMLEQLEI